MKLNREDAIRLYECVSCPYHDRCVEEIDEPEDNLDGSCRTKQLFEVKEGSDESIFS